MAEPVISAPAEVTQDDRTMATLAHVLQVVGWWLAPLIIFLVKRNSRFVSFHALQAIFLQILHMFFSGVLMIGFMVFMFATVMSGSGTTGHNPPLGLFFAFPFIWLGMMGMWVVILVVAIVYGVKAGRGEWADYPVLGRLSRRILKIGPDGTELTT